MAVDHSFDDFARQVGPRLARAGAMITGDRGAGEDLAQETLIRVYRNWWRIRDPQRVDAYAVRALVRLAHRHMRHAGVRLEQVGSGVDLDRPQMVAFGNSDPDIFDAVQRLPPRQRQVVVLRYVLDLSVESTATYMRCDPGTVKSQASKALRKLRCDLSGHANPRGDTKELSQ